MENLRIVVAGPGRAGGALILAATDAGHEIVGVLSRRPEAVPEGLPRLEWDATLPACDLLLVAVRDDAIAGVAGRLAPHAGDVEAMAHLSGFVPVDELQPFGDRVGSLHPLQTLPDPKRGAASLAGCCAAITSNDGATFDLLSRLASSLGMQPFALADAAKPWYHAGAAAASNYVVEALAVASDLFARAGVPLEVARPLTERIVANCFEDGPGGALTGPVARSDVTTVAGHLAAAGVVSPALRHQLEHLAEATALRAGTHDRLTEAWTGG